ncbi:hypothetical protein GCM10007853_11040 [Algimonas ampicilliniresistens]|uniref:Yip1 domain-containing protein n=1 Tax=Algimonas ampicilliniresistens TaxID=1298735 RepID=A0ABQ5V854_9PROT|nr:hypothetical protein [Algimonas ampicilliniresistens]GLQ23230.1 hypothetical protein GCM10007853_11040 [Algimonas ampicilliniresistens]
MTKMKETSEPKPDTVKRVGFDDFLDDIFGISIKGLKSIWTLIVDPTDYFEAARHGDWQGRFTPALRIWLSIMTIMIALQFIWAADASSYMDSITQIPRAFVDIQIKQDGANIEALNNYNMLDAAKRINTRNMLIYPVIFIAVFLLLSAIFRPWRNGENFVVSQRYIFGVIVPASVLGLTTTVLSYLAPPSFYTAYTNIQLVVIGVVYAITAYRGPMRDFEKDRVGMSIVMALIMLVGIFIAQIISMLIASFPIIMEIVQL